MTGNYGPLVLSRLYCVFGSWVGRLTNIGYTEQIYICITESSLGIGCFFFLGMQKLKEDLDSDVMKSENE